MPKCYAIWGLSLIFNEIIKRLRAFDDDNNNKSFSYN